jgi:hypothetical protein
MPMVRGRHGTFAAARAVLRLAMAFALWLPIGDAAGDDLAWLPLTAFDAEARTMIEDTAVREVGSTLFDFGRPATIEVAFAEIDGRSGDVPAEDRSEIILRLVPDACSRDHCPIMILSWHQGSYRMLTTQRGPGFALGTRFSHGVRDIVVRGEPLWFTGRDYLNTGSVEGWRVLTDLAPTDRAWIEAALGIGVERLPAPHLPTPDRVFVATVELDEAPPAATAAPEVIVVDVNFQSCGRRGCTITVYSGDGDRHAAIGDMVGDAVDLGPAFHNGKRDLLIDGAALSTFDGARYASVARRPPPPDPLEPGGQ